MPHACKEKSKLELVNAHKYKTRKGLGELDDKFYTIVEKINDPLSVEDLLKDTVVETAFPNIRRLLKICFNSEFRGSCIGASRRWANNDKKTYITGMRINA